MKLKSLCGKVELPGVFDKSEFDTIKILNELNGR